MVFYQVVLLQVEMVRLHTTVQVVLVAATMVGVVMPILMVKTLQQRLMAQVAVEAAQIVVVILTLKV